MRSSSTNSPESLSSHPQAVDVRLSLQHSKANVILHLVEDVVQQDSQQFFQGKPNEEEAARQLLQG